MATTHIIQADHFEQQPVTRHRRRGGRAKRFTDTQEADIRADYAAGMSILKIAEKYGAPDAGAVRRVLARLDVRIRNGQDTLSKKNDRRAGAGNGCQA